MQSKVDYEEEEEYEAEQEELREEATIYEAESPLNLGRSYIISVTYSGKKRCALVKLYEPNEGKIYYWYDNTGHKPYFYTDVPEERLRTVTAVALHRGLLGFEKVKLYDALHDKVVELTKIITKDPLAVGGSQNSLREIIPAKTNGRVWEANIKYHSSYIYDRGLIPGAPYKIVDGDLIPDFEEISHSELEEQFKDEEKEYFLALKEWLRILNQPVPLIKHVALDIEVEMETPTLMPSPKKAENRVIAVSCVGSDGLKKVFLLKRNIEMGTKPSDLDGVDIELIDNEVELLSKVFKIIASYPLLITFNGDNFDLTYLFHRAQKLGIPRERIPIALGKEIALITPGVHVDLYKFFHNKAIQVYAFSKKYDEVDLNSISKALLGVEKIVLKDFINSLPLYELAAYCYRDAWLTYSLVNFNDRLVLKLFVILMRITKLPIEDVTRIGISNWIKSMISFSLRGSKILISNKDEIEEAKGKLATTAIIKGKKYLGAKVIDPVPGIHFNVVVVDFASLYPSIIKIWNISYETVDCVHEECKIERLPGISHWACKKRRGVFSTLIGSLRDLRVAWYKPLSKRPDLDKTTKSQYEVIQASIKVILNAAYGVLGAESSDLYSPAAAESVTAIGRYNIDKTIEIAKSMNLEIIYGDTDSLFIKNPPPNTLKEFIEEVEHVLKVDLDIDKTYKYVVFSQRKKNYFGITKEGNADIKGLLGKKKHIPEFVKKTFYEIIDILKEIERVEDFEPAKEKIKKLTYSQYSLLKSGRISLSDLAIKVMMNKNIEDYNKTTPQHVKAALLLKNFGIEVKAGQNIAYVKVRTAEGVKPVQLARLDEIDVNKYIEMMRSSLEQLLEPSGIDFEEILGTSSLGKFM
ncbi:MAG TPA: DNA-directed DNA polymerase I [Geobacterales bacterium]|nr:DNA-directed DNA polymerase I [Geobacterales bacterium]